MITYVDTLKQKKTRHKFIISIELMNVVSMPIDRSMYLILNLYIYYRLAIEIGTVCFAILNINH